MAPFDDRVLFVYNWYIVSISAHVSDELYHKFFPHAELRVGFEIDKSTTVEITYQYENFFVFVVYAVWFANRYIKSELFPGH